MGETDSDCRRCYYSQVPAINDHFFTEAVRPYCWFAAVMLFLSYIIGLWFTLRTHAAVIWNSEVEEKKTQIPSGPNGGASLPSGAHLQSVHQHNSSIGGSLARRETQIRETQLYKRILGQSLKQVGLTAQSPEDFRQVSSGDLHEEPSQYTTPYLVPPRSGSTDTNAVDNSSIKNLQIEGLSEEQNNSLVRQVAEMAATAATVAARDATRVPRRAHANSGSLTRHVSRMTPSKPGSVLGDAEDVPAVDAVGHGAGGGHDAPNWSRMKSAVILLGATILYAVIAEILVNTVDVVLQSVDIDEKFLGITLFALVPNTTEFLVSENAIQSSTPLIMA